jgi:hypothetical protein
MALTGSYSCAVVDSKHLVLPIFCDEFLHNLTVVAQSLLAKEEAIWLLGGEQGFRIASL